MGKKSLGFIGAGRIACWGDLTDDQKAQLQSRHDAFMAEMNPLRDELFSKRMELRELWTKANLDQAKISAKQQEIRDLQAQMQEKATAYQLEWRQMLTPEQRDKMTVTQASFGGKGGGQGCLDGPLVMETSDTPCGACPMVEYRLSMRRFTIFLFMLLLPGCSLLQPVAVGLLVAWFWESSWHCF